MSTMSSDAAVQALARAREQDAEDVEVAIALLGAAYQRLQRTTQQLDARIGADLSRRLDAPIVLHFGQAGLSAFLERKLVGTPGSLRTLVAEQHDRAGIPSA